MTLQELVKFKDHIMETKMSKFDFIKVSNFYVQTFI